MNKKVTIAIIAAILLAGIVAYLTIATQGDIKEPIVQQQQPLTKVRMMDPLEANNLHLRMAESQGLFRKHGIEASVSGTSAGKLAMDALNGGAVEYAVVVDMNIAQTLFESPDVIILAEVAEPIRAIKILGRTDKGVQQASDLRGKKIGVLFGVNVHLFLLRYLAENGIREDEVELTNLRPPDAVAAFENGDVDAIITWQPHVARLQRGLGEKVVILTDDDDAYWKYRMMLATKRSRWLKHRDEARAVLRAILDADDLIRREPERAKQVLAESLNLEAEMVDSFYDEIQFRVQISKELPGVLETDVQWLREKFHEGKPPLVTDMNQLIAPDLKELRPTSWHLEG
jgi:NitT/TauT family transport system substrate-binding protein